MNIDGRKDALEVAEQLANASVEQIADALLTLLKELSRAAAYFSKAGLSIRQ